MSASHSIPTTSGNARPQARRSPFASAGTLLAILLTAPMAACLAQAATHAPAQPPAPTSAERAAQLEQKMEAISASLAATQQQILRSQQQMQQLQQQLADIRREMADSATTTTQKSAPTAVPASGADSNAPIEERVQALEAAVKLHEQTKVESSSKYPVRLTGLILFNAYLNKGVSDNTDLPDFALPVTASSGNGSLGASLRQSILGVQAEGPRLGSARTSANVSLDFFASVAYTSYGTSAGVVRMRTASIDLDWANDSLEAGIVPPLIAPLAPTSYATLAEPALAGAGNLWTWAPQLRYTHRLPLQQGARLLLELGLWDSPAAGYNPNQLFRTASPAEQSQQPAYEERISYATGGEHGLQLGLGGYLSRQSYPGYQAYAGTERLDSWAITGDWRVPVTRNAELTGALYRGRSLGGLGGGLYKDVVTGTSPLTGASVLQPLNAAGGWTQLKLHFSSTREANFSIGQDDGFAADFHAVVQSPTATATQLRARNRMISANLIFRPRTYVILSPEYRRIWSWPISGPASTLNVFTLSAGFQF